MILTSNQLKALLFNQQAFHSSYIYNKGATEIHLLYDINTEYFKNFFSQYRNDNKLNLQQQEQLLNVENNLKNKFSEYADLYKSIYMTNYKGYNNRINKSINEDKVIIKFYEEVSEVLTQLPIPIAFYNDNFWLLFNFKLSEETKKDWKNMNSSHFIVNEIEKDLIEFLSQNKTPDFFKSFTEYLFTIKHVSYAYTKLWYKEALKAENKKVLKKQSYDSRFNFHLNAYKRKDNQGAIRVCKILGLFEISSVKDKLISIYEENNGDMLYQEKIKVVLDGVGVSVKINEIEDILSDLEYTPIINKKVISIQSMMKKASLHENKMEVVQKLLEFILNKELQKYGAEIEVTKEYNYHVVKENYYTPVIKIRMISSQSNHKDALSSLNNILNYYINYFLINDFKKHDTYTLSSPIGQETISQTFLDNLEKFKLYESLNNNLTQENKSVSKMKI